MALKKYIGARYTPKFMGAWDAQTVYAALSVVYANEQSYVSRKTVPAGTELSNTEYWVKSADWNAQVAEYNRNVENYNKNVVEYNKNVVAYEQAVNTFYADTLHSYDTKAAMVADQDLKLGDTLLTCGGTAIGDGGGSFYQVVAETSAKAVALENGLYALPFEFQPYDFSEFKTEVDNYKKDTDQQIKTFETTVKQDVAQMKEVSLHTYNTQNQMKADRTLTPNTVVMTAGEAAVGDNKGSFYEVQETSDKTDAVPLDNGRKAVPFALNVGVVAGTELSFQGKSDAVGVWNVKAPNTITIPITVTGTATAFLGVLYNASQATVKVNLVINGESPRALTFTDSGDSTHDKIVVYAITVKKQGDGYAWGQSTTASWTVNYQTDKTVITQTYPESGLVPLTKQGNQLSNPFSTLWEGSVNRAIHLNTITANFGNHVPYVALEKQNGEHWDRFFEYYGESKQGTATINLNADFNPNEKYHIICFGKDDRNSWTIYMAETTIKNTSILSGYGTPTTVEDDNLSFELQFVI